MIETQKQFSKKFGGARTTFKVTLDYNAFDKITLPEAMQTVNFFPNKKVILSEAKKEFETLITSSNDTSNFDWNFQKKIINKAINALNATLQKDFSKLADKVIDCNHFYEYLEDLEIIGFSNFISLTSKYSSMECRCSAWSDVYDLVVDYTESLIKSKELYFEDFEIWDSFFYDTIYKWYKNEFGYYYEDEDDEEAI